MLPQDRYALILNMLIEQNSVKISDIATACSVSHETARRDLEILQERGIAKRVHGGAVFLHRTSSSSPLHIPEQIAAKGIHQETRAIAMEAAKLVCAGESIFLDAGTTMGYMSQYLENLSDLSILTPSLYSINALSKSRNRVICLGGVLSVDEQCFIGPIAQNTFSSFYVDKAFFSCAGLQIEKGILTDYDADGIPRSLIREHAEKMILVISSRKINTKAFVEVFSMDGIDTIVVDSGISKENADFIRQTGIELIIAPSTSYEEK